MIMLNSTRTCTYTCVKRVVLPHAGNHFVLSLKVPKKQFEIEETRR
jgi:hypothetical protein